MYRLSIIRVTVFLLGLFFALSTPTLSQAPPGAFRVIAPGEVIQAYDVWTLFRWEPSAGAATYCLQVSNAPTFDEASMYATFDSLTSTEFKPSRDLIMDRVYFWRVVAYDDDRSDSTISLAKVGSLPYQEFETIPPEVPRVLSCSNGLDYNRTIIPENTPYILQKSDSVDTASFVVPNGLWLAIDSGQTGSQGLTLLVDGKIRMEVHGQLLWQGAGSRRITIESASENPAPGQWRNVFFADEAPDAQFDPDWDYIEGSGSKIVNVDFRHSGSDLSRTIDASMASVYVAGCSFSESSDDHAFYISGGSFITGNYISGYKTRTGTTRAGAGIYCQGEGNRIAHNYITQCSTWVEYYGSLTAISKGGGIYVGGVGNQIDSNRIYRCVAYANNTHYSYRYRCQAFGGGVQNEGLRTHLMDNTIEQCKAFTSGGFDYAYGGGLWNGGDSAVVDGGTISECAAHFGGGIYADSYAIRISDCSVVNDSAKVSGGGIWMIDGTVWASTIKYNKATDSTGAGIYGDPDTVRYCNLNNNYGYNISKRNANPDDVTEAAENWWYSRDVETDIKSGIWDFEDTDGASQLGPVNVDPPLMTVSDSTRDAFRNAQSLTLMNDDTYSSPLSGGLTENDTVYFRLVGDDENVFIKNVAVIYVANRTTGEYIWPYYEETNDTSGVWEGVFYLTDQIDLPDKLAASNGDVLDIFVHNDSLVKLRYVVGETECFSAYSGTGNSCTIQIDALTASGGLAAGDQVGVFDREFCVGVETYGGGGFPFTVTAWADDAGTPEQDGYTVGNDISLRVARAGTCNQIDLCPDGGWTTGDGTFVNGSTLQVSLIDDCGGCQILKLGTGWNFVSMNVAPAINDIEQMFSEIVSNVNVMVECDQDYWAPGYGINQIGNWDSQAAYAIHLDAHRTMQFCGDIIPCDDPISLLGGWNCIPYYPSESMDVVSALTSIFGSLEICKAPNGTFYIPGVGNFLGDMYPTLGYKVSLSAPGTLQYPCSPPARSKIFASGSSLETVTHFAIPRATQDYHATVIKSGDGLRDGDEIGVFLSDGQLVGSGVVHLGTAAIAIWYDDASTATIDGYTAGSEVELRVWSKAKDAEHSIPSTAVLGIDELGASAYSVMSIDISQAAIMPHKFELSANYPNPFNPTTTVEFSLEYAGHTTLTVYNALGQVVQTLIESDLDAGPHSAMWDGKDRDGHAVASGLYLYRLSQGDRQLARKMLLLK